MTTSETSPENAQARRGHPTGPRDVLGSQQPRNEKCEQIAVSVPTPSQATRSETSPHPATPRSHTPQTSRSRRLLRFVEHLLAVSGLCFLIYHLCFEYTVMTSGSMSPALQGDSFETGDGILLEKVSRWFRSPRRWEIYHFYNSDGTPVAKRIVGLPGEKLSMKGNQLLINGQPLTIPAHLKPLKYFAYGNLAAGREVACGTGYFVLGDDSKDSYDSRYLGTVPKESFRGRAWLILRPSSRAGWVH